MSRPKEVHPGQLTVISRRTTHRHFFWRPGRDTRSLFGYMFGKAVHDKRVLAIVASLLSNHFHAMLLDLMGLRSGLMQQAFSNASRKRNLQLGRRENLWAPGKPGDMTVLDMEKAVEQVLYIVMQPVAAGLVEKVEDWTGFQILPRDWGKPMRFERPDLCGPDMPEFVEFTPGPPPGFEQYPLEEVIEFFEARIAEEEARYAKKRRGRPVLGIEICEAMNPFRTPKTPARMRTLNPRFTSSDPRLIQRALKRLREFQRQHLQASRAFRKGQRDVLFPAGTLQMVSRAGAHRADTVEGHPLSLSTEWTHELQSSWDSWRATRAA